MTEANTTVMQDEFAAFKAGQKEVWAGFGAMEGFTIVTAGELVSFAHVRAGERVLDVACGTGVVAVTAARAGAHVTGLDLTPILLERARENATTAGVQVEFVEGDVEHLPFANESFDVVLSQFGHMFAPRPEVALSEMLRVLKGGGRIAFSTWPPEHVTGQLFTIIASQTPAPPEGTRKPVPPVLWGDANIIRQRLGDSVTNLRFSRGAMIVPALSAKHVQAGIEMSFGPLKTMLAKLDAAAPERASAVRGQITDLIHESMDGNVLPQHFLMTAAVKRRDD